jgi:hypothetical protein
MRTLLLPTLFALGVGLTAIASASFMIGPGITDKAAANFSPRVRQAAYDCRTVMKCTAMRYAG